MKDTERAVDMAENLLAKEIRTENGEDSSDIDDVKEGDRRDHGRHEGLQILPPPAILKQKINHSISLIVCSRYHYRLLLVIPKGL